MSLWSDVIVTLPLPTAEHHGTGVASSEHRRLSPCKSTTGGGCQSSDKRLQSVQMLKENTRCPPGRLLNREGGSWGCLSPTRLCLSGGAVLFSNATA
mmetsp:Transcript_56912/g.93617  ORF Transcript_56912/g.93617 Transcript_56912/m.93617 type:complete len:97 (-) Transcript_56912:454-744(-)